MIYTNYYHAEQLTEKSNTDLHRSVTINFEVAV
jgi:hypothetical protein